jgi:hypothetical protein
MVLDSKIDICKDAVITIHGVNPDLTWQDRVREVLEPHFNCIKFRYEDYDTWLGPLRAVFHVKLLLIGLAFLGLFALVAWLDLGWVAAMVCGGIVLISLVLSPYLAYRKRRKCAENLKKMIEKVCQYTTPHIVAHSLGTLLIGSVIKKYPDIRLGNMILVSGVLSQRYPWQRLVSGKSKRVVGYVRNEFGESDQVTRLAGKLGWIARGLGKSGRIGFKSDGMVVHTSDNPTAKCSQCNAIRAKVHNVPLEEFGHSDEFLGEGHARHLWLPFLWDTNLDELHEYWRACENAVRWEVEQQYYRVDEALEDLWNSRFSWTKGQKLVDFVSKSIPSHLRRSKVSVTTGDLLDTVRSKLHVVTFYTASITD